MAARRNLKIYQGDDYTHEVVFGEDVSDREFLSQIRDENNNLVAEFDVDMVDAGNGNVFFGLTHAVVSDIASGVYVYDVQQTTDAGVLTLLKGRVVVEEEVSRD